LNYIDPDGKEPNTLYAGTINTFVSVMNNSTSRIGLTSKESASQALIRLGQTEMNWKQGRSIPVSTPYFNKRAARYIYTKKGGWIDMTHFLFYAGRAFNYKQQKSRALQAINLLNDLPQSTKNYMRGDGTTQLMKTANLNPIGEAVQDGYRQERSDALVASHSAFSYEDLPSDYFGADFAVNYFDSNSELTLGEQILNYFTTVLDSAAPSDAPNYGILPTTDESTKKPSRTNESTTPVYIKNNP
jgi:hypothetical protein